MDNALNDVNDEEKREIDLRDIIPPRPREGWIKEIREALLMSQAQIAKRLGVHPSTISRSQKAEIENTITIGRLEEIAEALDCNLMYVFIPKKDI